jgi:hypothetical protein
MLILSNLQLYKVREWLRRFDSDPRLIFPFEPFSEMKFVQTWSLAFEKYWEGRRRA